MDECTAAKFTQEVWGGERVDSGPSNRSATFSMYAIARACPRQIRRYSTTKFPPLPPTSEWRSSSANNTTLRPSRPRVCLSNEETAARVVDAFFPPGESHTGRSKVIIEAFSGPGVLTRALLQLPPNRLRKLIVLEDSKKFYQIVGELEAHDSRLKAMCLNGTSWDSYHQIEQEGLLSDIETSGWNEETDLEFVCHIPHSIHGEQFVAQILRAIPERSWLFKYGRVRLNLIMADGLYHRIHAPIKKSKRCKLSVVAEATTQFDLALPPAELKPYDDNFWPPSYISRTILPDSRRSGHPMVAATFLPLANQFIQPGMLDKWDFCLRQLFVLKAFELRKALPSLAPGASNMLQYMQGEAVKARDRVDVKQTVNALTVKDWAKVVKAFDKWPFAPEMLYIPEARIEKN